jgi:hypothetical protein
LRNRPVIVGVAVGVGVLVGVFVGVALGLAVGVTVGVFVPVGVTVGVTVGVVVGVPVGVELGLAVGVAEGVTVDVTVGVIVGVGDGVTVNVGVTEGVTVGVTLGVAVAVKVAEGVDVGVAGGILAPNPERTPRPPYVFARVASIKAARDRSDNRASERVSYQLPPLNPAPCAFDEGHPKVFASPIASSTPSPWSAPLNDLPAEFATVTTRSHNPPERSITPKNPAPEASRVLTKYPKLPTRKGPCTEA